MNLFDSSALLCFLLGETGADEVETALTAGPGACSAANWSEVAQKMRQHGRDSSVPLALLASYGIQVEPVVRADAELAADRWRAGSGLSLADRLCLATGARLGATVWTADRAWGTAEPVRQVR